MALGLSRTQKLLVQKLQILVACCGRVHRCHEQLRQKVDAPLAWVLQVYISRAKFSQSHFAISARRCRGLSTVDPVLPQEPRQRYGVRLPPETLKSLRRQSRIFEIFEVSDDRLSGE